MSRMTTALLTLSVLVLLSPTLHAQASKKADAKLIVNTDLTLDIELSSKNCKYDLPEELDFLLRGKRRSYKRVHVDGSFESPGLLLANALVNGRVRCQGRSKSQSHMIVPEWDIERVQKRGTHNATSSLVAPALDWPLGSNEPAGRALWREVTSSSECKYFTAKGQADDKVVCRMRRSDGRTQFHLTPNRLGGSIHVPVKPKVPTTKNDGVIEIPIIACNFVQEADFDLIPVALSQTVRLSVQGKHAGSCLESLSRLTSVLVAGQPLEAFVAKARADFRSRDIVVRGVPDTLKSGLNAAELHAGATPLGKLNFRISKPLSIRSPSVMVRYDEKAFKYRVIKSAKLAELERQLLPQLTLAAGPGLTKTDAAGKSKIFAAVDRTTAKVIINETRISIPDQLSHRLDKPSSSLRRKGAGDDRDPQREIQLCDAARLVHDYWTIELPSEVELHASTAHDLRQLAYIVHQHSPHALIAELSHHRVERPCLAPHPADQRDMITVRTRLKLADGAIVQSIPVPAQDLFAIECNNEKFQGESHRWLPNGRTMAIDDAALERQECTARLILGDANDSQPSEEQRQKRDLEQKRKTQENAEQIEHLESDLQQLEKETLLLTQSKNDLEREKDQLEDRERFLLQNIRSVTDEQTFAQAEKQKLATEKQGLESSPQNFWTRKKLQELEPRLKAADTELRAISAELERLNGLKGKLTEKQQENKRKREGNVGELAESEREKKEKSAQLNEERKQARKLNRGRWGDLERLSKVLGPQRFEVRVTRTGMTDAVLAHSLSDFTKVRIPIPAPAESGTPAGPYTVTIRPSISGRKNAVLYRGADPTKAAKEEFAELEFRARMRPRGAFGWGCFQEWGVRTYATVSTNLVGLRGPVFPETVNDTSDPKNYQFVGPRVALLAVAELWDYQRGTSKFPISAAGGVSLVDLGEGDIRPSSLLGFIGSLPVSEESSGQLGTSLALGAFWESNLRGRHAIVGTVGLNLGTFFSPPPKTD